MIEGKLTDDVELDLVPLTNIDKKKSFVVIEAGSKRESLQVYRSSTKNTTYLQPGITLFREEFYWN